MVRLRTIRNKEKSMRQAGAVLKLITCDGSSNFDTDRLGARSVDAGQEGRAGSKPADAPAPRDLPHDKGDAARGARHDLLKDWMGSHTRILGLWLDRLLEEGDDAELVSMIHRQHAWLSMMQVRMERG
jgi:hypothetical protein